MQSGEAVVTGGDVLFGWFNFPPAASLDLAILLVLALIAVLLAGVLYVLSARRRPIQRRHWWLFSGQQTASTD